MQDSRATTILLADDHAIVREGLAALCATNPGFQVIAQCSDGEAALELITSEKPDFAILDLNMPKMTGLEVIRKLRADGCSTKLVILSISRDETTVMEALRAGADAYLLKDGPSRHLLDAINFVRDSGVYVSPLLRGAGLFTKGTTSGPRIGWRRSARAKWRYSLTSSTACEPRILPICSTPARKPSTRTARA